LLQEHVRTAEHRWEANPDLRQCARPSITAPQRLNLSYGNCSETSPTALLAIPVLLKASLRAVADLSELPRVDGLVTKLVEQWTSRFAAKAQRAREYSLSRPTVGGTWSCPTDSGTASIEIFDEGLLKGSLPSGLTDRGNDVVFMSYLSLSADRRAFEAQGVLTLARRPQGEHSNIVFSTACRYPFLATLGREVDNPQLTIVMRSSGRPELDDGCPVLSPVARTFTCEQVE
jgi:hypothetical protein